MRKAKRVNIPSNYLSSLEPYLGSYSAEEQEIIKFIFTLGYTELISETVLSESKYLKIAHPNYSIPKILALCEKFIHSFLSNDIDLNNAINIIYQNSKKNLPL